ncbi:MAG: response regulator [Deltaproteobacteria bacterium]|nr:MAG: response regulator [Deltaproteobacteria bacterium]
MQKKILVVDDSATVRQAVRIPLEKTDYLCIEAVDGRDALARLAAESVDLIITDINMPNLDGFGFIREARKLAGARFTPIIILTTESSEEMKKQGKAAGASGWIVKPFQADQLLKVIRLLVK